MRRVTTALALCASVAVAAQAPTLTFAVGEWCPYTEAAPGEGLAAELVRAACTAAGLASEFEAVPWPRAEIMVLNGRSFASFPYPRQTMREPNFLHSDPIIESSVVIVVNRNNPRTEGFSYGGNPEAFKGYSVGTTEGSIEVAVPLRTAGARVEETPTPDPSILKLEMGRIDFVVDEARVASSAIARLYPDGNGALEILPAPFIERIEYGLLASRAFPDAERLLERFNDGLRSIRADGTWSRILKRRGAAKNR